MNKNRERKVKRKELQDKIEANAQEAFNSLTPEIQDQVVGHELQRMIMAMRERINKLQIITGSKVSFKYCFPISDLDTRTVFIELSKEHSTIINTKESKIKLTEINKEETND
jgi:hypothetical protein